MFLTLKHSKCINNFFHTYLVYATLTANDVAAPVKVSVADTGAPTSMVNSNISILLFIRSKKLERDTNATTARSGFVRIE